MLLDFYNFEKSNYNCSVLPIDMADKYAPLIGGTGLAGLTIAYALNPIVIGFMVRNHVSMHHGRKSFNVVSGIHKIMSSSNRAVRNGISISSS